jgi:6-phosphogluconolactonase (cycloisomerase 2 family)
MGLGRGVVLALVTWGALASAAAPSQAAAKSGARNFVYVNDTAGRASVFGFALASDGTLTPLAGSPYTADWNGPNCGGPCNTMSYSARRKVLVSGTGGGVTVWRVAADGTLSVVPGSPFGSGTDVAIGTRVVDVGRRSFAYTATSNEGKVRGWEILADGTLAELPSSPVDAGSAPVALDANRRRLLCVGGAPLQPGEITSWLVAKDGALTRAAGTPVQTLTSAFSARIEPRGKYVFAAAEGTAVASYAFDRKKATLTPLAGSPTESGFPSTFDAAIPSAKGLLLVPAYDEDGAGDLQMFRFDRKGALSKLGAPQDSGLSLVESGTFTADGRTLVLASRLSAEVRTYSVDLRTGRLAPRDTEPLGAGALHLNEVLVVRR